MFLVLDYKRVVDNLVEPEILEFLLWLKPDKI